MPPVLIWPAETAESSMTAPVVPDDEMTATSLVPLMVTVTDEVVPSAAKVKVPYVPLVPG